MCLFVFVGFGCASPTSAREVADADVDAGLDAPPPMGLADSRVVCATCARELLDAKREGILLAMNRMLRFTGADVLPRYAPVTFHLDGDATCGTAQQMIDRFGYLTGFADVDAQGKAYGCLFDVEKPARALPFTPSNARLLLDQLLPLHEAGHVWFFVRQDDLRVQEPFSKMMALVVSGTMSDPCRTFRVRTPPDNLIAALCDVGVTMRDVPEIFRRTALAADEQGRALSNVEFCAVVSAVIGRDAAPAFRSVGVL